MLLLVVTDNLFTEDGHQPAQTISKHWEQTRQRTCYFPKSMTDIIIKLFSWFPVAMVVWEIWNHGCTKHNSDNLFNIKNAPFYTNFPKSEECISCVLHNWNSIFNLLQLCFWSLQTPEGNNWLFDCLILHCAPQVLSNCVCRPRFSAEQVALAVLQGVFRAFAAKNGAMRGYSEWGSVKPRDVAAGTTFALRGFPHRRKKRPLPL